MRSPPAFAAVALGSNLADRAANLAFALQLLASHPHIRSLRASKVIESAPVRVSHADPGGPFLNAAAAFQTYLSPFDLLDLFHSIERSLGRDRSNPAASHGSPRTIDLDLLLYNELTLNTPTLTIPHPALAARRFVLEPLADVAPHVRVPPTMITANELFRESIARDSPPSISTATRTTALTTAALVCVSSFCPRAAAAQPFVSRSRVLAAPSSAPPEPHPSPAIPASPASLTASQVIDRARDAHLAAPAAHRVELRVTDSAGSVRSSSFVVRTNPTLLSSSAPTAAVQPGPDSPAPLHARDASSLLLELGSLRVSAGLYPDPPGPDRAEWIAENIASPTLYHRGPLPRDPRAWLGTLLRELPPIPAPHLELIASARIDSLGSFCTNITWISSAPGPDAATWSLRGTCSDASRTRAGEISLLTNPSGTIDTLVATFPRSAPSDLQRVELRLLPMDPGPPESWPIPTASRHRVDSLAALRPLPPALVVGQKVPAWALLTPDATEWAWESLLQPDEFGRTTARHVIVAFFRDPAGAPDAPPRTDVLATSRLVQATAETLARLRDDARLAAAGVDPERSIDPFEDRAALVISLEQPAAMAAMRDTARAWESLPGVPPGWVVWTPSPSTTIERLARDAPAVIAVIGPGRVLERVIPLEGETTNARDIYDQLRACLGPAPAPPLPTPLPFPSTTAPPPAPR